MEPDWFFAAQRLARKMVCKSNVLNQHPRTPVEGNAVAGAFVSHDADGNLTHVGVAGDLNCDGVVDNGDWEPFVLALMSRPPNYPKYYGAYPMCDVLRADINQDGVVDNGDIDGFVGLLLGGSSGVAVRYEWDGENRLVAAGPNAGVTPTAGMQRSQYLYDYLGRRIEKRVWTYSAGGGAGWGDPRITRFVWDGWRLLEELDGRDLTGPNGTGGPDGQPDNAVLRKHTWGNDLSGSLEGAGTIGGLIAVEDLDPNTSLAGTFLYHYDANGNVSELVDVTYVNGEPAATFGDIVAHYEYDAFGNTIVATSAYAESNPFRFSTKYYDAETGLYYYGYRYYSPKLGRWINRDPIGERGGMNVYSAMGNALPNSLDPLGLDDSCSVMEAFASVLRHLSAQEWCLYNEGERPGDPGRRMVAEALHTTVGAVETTARNPIVATGLDALDCGSACVSAGMCGATIAFSDGLAAPLAVPPAMYELDRCQASGRRLGLRCAGLVCVMYGSDAAVMYACDKKARAIDTEFNSCLYLVGASDDGVALANLGMGVWSAGSGAGMPGRMPLRRVAPAIHSAPDCAGVPTSLRAAIANPGGMLSGGALPPCRVGVPAEEAVSRYLGIPRNIGSGRATISGSGPGGYRVPDFDPALTIPKCGAIISVKDMARIYWTRQIADELTEAQRANVVLRIYTDAPVPCRGSLRRWYDRRWIDIQPIP